MRRAILYFGMCGMLVACGSQQDKVPGRGSTADAWQIDREPVLVIGRRAPDAEPEFLYTRGATRLSNGAVVIADTHDGSIRFFDAAGKPIRKVGRRGAGPGEFGAPWWLEQCGADSVFVWEPDRHITVIDSAGAVVRTFSPPPNTVFLECSRSGVFAGISDVAPTSSSQGGGPVFEGSLWLTDSNGRITRSLGKVPVGEFGALGKVTQLAVGPDRLYVGTADSAFVDVYSHDGEHLSTLPIGVSSRRSTREHYEAAIDLMVTQQLRDRAAQENSRRMLRERPMPDYLPPYTNLFTDPAGTLWAVTSVPGDTATEIRAVRGDSELLANVRLPTDATIFEVGSDYILAAQEDESGEQYVSMYRLRQTRSMGMAPKRATYRMGGRAARPPGYDALARVVGGRSESQRRANSPF